MIVRKPKPSELQEMVDLGKVMWGEGVFNVTEDYDSDAAMDFGLNALTESMSGGDFYMCVAKEDESSPIIGMVIGQSVPYFFCPKKKMVVDHIVYVHKDKRGSSAAYRMLKDFEDWAKTQNAVEISMGVSTGIHPEKTHDFYTKMGYTHAGGIYKKPLNQSKEI